MSAPTANPQRQAEQQRRAHRLRAFHDLLDPSNRMPGHAVADLYSLRQLCLQGGGIPEGSTAQKWIRSQAWMVMLGYLPPEKSEWTQTLDRRRGDYYQFVSALASSPDGSDDLPGSSPERDALLDQIYRDLSRSRRNAFAFYRAEVEPSWTCPLTEAPKEAAEPQTSSSRRCVERIRGRHALLRRLEKINADFAETMRDEARGGRASSSAAAIPRISTPIQDPTAGSRSPPIFLQPPSPQDGAREGNSRAASPFSGAASDDGSFASANEGESDDERGERKAAILPPSESPPPFADRRWHSLLRILYIHALLNPSTGYVQGMGEIVWVLFYVLGNAGAPASDKGEAGEGEQSFTYIPGSDDVAGAHAEADAFHLFQALAGELRDVYDFEGIDHGAAGLHIRNSRAGDGTGARRKPQKRTGMAGALRRLSLRLKWLDEDLWDVLHRNSLDPRQPYFSLRWLACCLSTELSLPSIVQVWDCLLAEADDARPQADSSELVATSAKVELLIDVCCALLISLRGRLLDALEVPGPGDPFERGMAVLQDFSELEVSPVIDLACLYRQRRLAAPLTGDAPPDDDDDEDEGDESTASMSALRDRARQALNAWGSNTSASPGSRWLQSLKTRAVGEGDDATTTPASSQPPTPSTPRAASSPLTASARLQRYAVALQSSDAAASLSKASTNLTAKAMASWAASSPLLTRSRETSPEAPETPSSTSRMSSFAEMGSSFFRKASHGARSASMSSTSGGSQPATPVHPALRWNKDMPPIPLPNVDDDDPGREEYAWGARRPGSIAGASPTSSRAGSVSGSPAIGSGSFDSSPRSSTLPRSIARGPAGRKPLLMAAAARPPREGSHAEALAAEPSRKISSGPLGISAAAGNGNGVAPPGRPSMASSRSSSYRRDSGSVSGASVGFRSRQASEAEGEGSSMDSATWTSQTAPVASPVTAEMDVGTPVPPLAPLLPSLQAAAAAGLGESSSQGQSNGDASMAPLGLMGSGHGTGHGTVPASAFAKVRAVSGGDAVEEPPLSPPANGIASRKSASSRPSFGQVESSSDVPLVRTSGRSIRSRRLGQRGGSESARGSIHEDGDEGEGGEDGVVVSPEPDSGATLTRTRKYTLTDGPVPESHAEVTSPSLGERDAASMYEEPPSSTASPLRRSTGASTTSGISRSKLTYSGKKTRTASASSSSFGGGTPSSASVQDGTGTTGGPTPSTARTSVSSVVGGDRRSSNVSRRSYTDSAASMYHSNGAEGVYISSPPVTATTDVRPPSPGEGEGLSLSSTDLMRQLQLEGEGQEEVLIHHHHDHRTSSTSASGAKRQSLGAGAGADWPIANERTATDAHDADADVARPAIFGHAPRDSRGFRRVARDVPFDDGDGEEEVDFYAHAQTDV